MNKKAYGVIEGLDEGLKNLPIPPPIRDTIRNTLDIDAKKGQMVALCNEKNVKLLAINL